LNSKSTLGRSDASTEPAIVPGLDPVVEVVAGHGSTVCALTDEGKVWCWGENENAEAGSMENAEAQPLDKQVEPPLVLPPRLVPGIEGATALAVGGNHACAWNGDGKLWCW